ncbi:alpha-amylase family glycosyl hydrolase [Dactylosporangium fulvum]|uniref:Alpha-amylase family glycosyl hydrolase n=1 Tax=Dactylosporangium fulvum TaxID=53359 RepID=A0ABY5VR80_9ACTN|nr:alpha-amylase family glycosyl hydrolase [Dactylosporangium fulvum]UWP80287.1 alpha-amylase family glycosyl hydrolase [Dactylosporangium fulvum]
MTLHDQPGTKEWWRGATLYHIYVRSFQDSNGDGHGDLAGIISRLDYLQWLGVDALWLSPTMPSPNNDWGYDVADYLNVQDDLGDLETLDRLIRDAGARGMKVMLDLVANHTSSAHPWFRDAVSSRDSEHRSYYVWADPKPDGSLPNNWVDDTGEVAWTLDETTGQYYFHNFLAAQPDLNWWEPRVHEEFRQIMEFWYERGVAGFRIDVANGLYKDKFLRDNPVNPKAVIYNTEVQGRYGIEHKFNFNQPETHGVYRNWRIEAEKYDPPRLLLGETWVSRVDELAPYYGDGDQLQLGFNFPLIFAPFEPRALAQVVRESFGSFPAGSATVWAGSNHDLPRMGTRWAKGDEDLLRVAHVILATLPGTYALYYGDELGMLDSDIPTELQQDPLTKGELNGQWPRDNARAPMRWDESAAGGFTTGSPWLPVHPDADVNVEREMSDAASVLVLVRTLIALHARHLAGSAEYTELGVDDDQWTYRSGPLVVVANFSDHPVDVPGGAGAPILTSRAVEVTGQVPAKTAAVFTGLT